MTKNDDENMTNEKWWYKYEVYRVSGTARQGLSFQISNNPTTAIVM